MDGTTSDSGVVAVLDSNTAGAVVFWRLSGAVRVEALKAAWLAAGLDEKLLPSPPTPVASMRRATGILEEKRILVRPLTGTKGWAVVREEGVQGSTQLAYQQLLTVTLDKDTKALLVQRDTVDNTTSDMEARLRAEFAHQLSVYSIEDFSAFMTGLVKGLDATSLRDTGGFYFTPREHLATFRTMVGAIRQASEHRIYEIPAMRSAEAVQAIMDAILAEAAQEATTIETEIDTGSLGERALQTRAARCADMAKKLEVYEALLGRSLEGIKERITGLHAQVTLAALAASADEGA